MVKRQLSALQCIKSSAYTTHTHTHAETLGIQNMLCVASQKQDPENVY